MPLSLYEITVPVFIQKIKTLQVLLDKAIEHAAGSEKEQKLLDARLIDDMKGLPFQVQLVSNAAKLLAVRIGLIPNTPWEDDETTFPQLQERLAKTIDFLEKVDPKSFDGREDAEIDVNPKLPKFTGTTYALNFAIPNFYFHLVTAYAILRKEGVQIGKKDYLTIY